jgi:hypothetical protein
VLLIVVAVRIITLTFEAVEVAVHDSLPDDEDLMFRGPFDWLVSDDIEHPSRTG